MVSGEVVSLGGGCLAHSPFPVRRSWKPTFSANRHSPLTTSRSQPIFWRDQRLDSIRRAERKFSSCIERILDGVLAPAPMRPSCDTDSIRFVADWPQARQKGVENLLSRLSCLGPLR